MYTCTHKCIIKVYFSMNPYVSFVISISKKHQNLKCKSVCYMLYYILQHLLSMASMGH